MNKAGPVGSLTALLWARRWNIDGEKSRRDGWDERQCIAV